MAQKFTGGIGNKLCGECQHPRAGGEWDRRRGKATFSALRPQPRSRGYSVRDGRGLGSRAQRAADRNPPDIFAQLCSTETPRSPRRAAGASPRGPPPGRPPVLATRSPAAVPKRTSTMHFCTQQVKAPRWAPGASARGSARAQPGAGARLPASRWRAEHDFRKIFS